MRGLADWAGLPEWEGCISHDWKGYTRQDLQQLFADMRNLRLQEPDRQNRYKLSFYVGLHHDHRGLRDRMRQRLTKLGVKASLIWSVDEAARVGLLDLLPEGATKYHAIDFLRRQLGDTEADTLFSGDSGNDLEVIASAIPSVLVANAQSEVRWEALRLVADGGTDDAFYQAQGGFMGMNGHYSAGTLEGVAHYHAAFAGRLKDHPG